MIVRDLIKKTKALDEEYNEGMLGPKESICSNNTKTGWSINFPIRGTCRPTKACSRLCYGAIKGKPITWDKSLLKYLRIYKYFKAEPAEVIAERIYREYKSHKMSFLRCNGVGDLFPESVKVINVFSSRYPDTVNWVVTRKPEMAAQIAPKSNIYLMFSLDKDSKDRKEKMDSFNHPRVYYSYLREAADEKTMKSRIVFNAHQVKKQLLYDDKHTTCPVDAGIIPVKGACETCRKCFSKGALDGSVHPAH